MRLEPVFVVSPRPVSPTMPTRRAFLLAGSTFAVGSALGGACGYSLAARAAEPAEVESSGDAELDDLRRLAVKAPIAELMTSGIYFLNMRDTTYSGDPVLWRGVDRIARQIVAAPDAVDRSLVLVVCATIERGGPPEAMRLADYLPSLTQIRSSKKR